MGIYCSTSDVKIVLKTNRANKIRFPEIAINNLVTAKEDKPIGGGLNSPSVGLKPQKNVDLAVNKGLIVADTGFSGMIKVFVYFDSATDYRVFVTDEVSSRRVLDGSGTISTDYIHTEGYFTILANAFFGTISVQDTVEFSVECHISDDEIEQFISLAEIEIDNFLMAGYHRLTSGTTDYNSGFQVRLFDATTLPDQIKSACSYLAAYLIYTTIFADEQRDFDKSKDFRSIHFSERWKKLVDNSLSNYLKIANRSVPKNYLPYSNISDKARVIVEYKKDICEIDLEVEYNDEII